MRALLAVLFSLTLLAGCADESPKDPGSPTTTYTGGPEDTLPVLGRWVSQGDGAERQVVLTLSDDNTYAATNECLELSGRWELRAGQVVLTPDPGSGVQCGEDWGEPIELPSALTVDGDRLVPDGVGQTFVRD